MNARNALVNNRIACKIAVYKGVVCKAPCKLIYKGVGATPLVKVSWSLKTAAHRGAPADLQAAGGFTGGLVGQFTR